MTLSLDVAEFSVIDLGLIEYQLAWDLQNEYAAQIARNERNPTLLLLEHPHVYTFGRSGHMENLLWGEKKLNERGVKVLWVDRGGDVTYHGPGQLVGYPLIPLGRPIAQQGEGSVRIPQVDYVGYVRKLEKVLISSLAFLGIAAGQRPGFTGVWVQADVASRCARCRPEDKTKPAKIAAIGVKVDAQGISRHGFGLNVYTDMSYFDGIIACGLADDPVVSLGDLLKHPPDMAEVKKAVVKSFGDVFNIEMKYADL